MSGNKLLLDTNILIYLSKKELVLDQVGLPGDSLHISVITLMEVKGFAFRTIEEEAFVDTLCKHLDVIHLNDDIIDEVIRVRKISRIKLPDAIILATAIVSGCTIITHNTSDFVAFSSLVRLVDPFNRSSPEKGM